MKVYCKKWSFEKFKSTINIVFFSLIALLVTGCECTETDAIYTYMENESGTDANIQYRYFNGNDENGNPEYLYFDEILSFSDIVKVQEISVKRHGIECIDDSSGRVREDSATVQFSSEVLEQYTICDNPQTHTIIESYDNVTSTAISARYFIRQIGESCGDYIRLDVEDGYP